MPDSRGETRTERNARFGHDSPERPSIEGGEHLWNCYTELTRCRAMGLNGLEPITPRDILDWSEMTGTALRREECSILIEMDATYRRVWSEEAAANAEREKPAPPQPVPQRRRR